MLDGKPRRKLSKPYREEYDDTWVSNRLWTRRSLKGTKLAPDPLTGYLTNMIKDGFTGEEKLLFVERLKICSNVSDVCRSIPIDVQTFYDALALDAKFRKDVNEACKTPNRLKKLNSALANIKVAENKSVISDLLSQAKKYE